MKEAQAKRIERFIPACAGNAYGCTSKAATEAVHPRVCGERVIAVASIAPCRGSSPRVRGTRINNSLYGCDLRFIPACAGNAQA